MADTELDQDFLTKFSCLGTTDRDVLVNELHSLLGSQLSKEGCAFFLDMTNWNLQAAVGAYYDFYGNSQLPEMTLVEDITVGNGEAVAPDTEFTKTWKIKNSGTEAWPSGVYMSFRSGDLMNGPTFSVLPSLKPEEEIDVTMRLRSPKVPGLYQGQWKMTTPNGSIFGDTIWAIVSVEEGGVLGLAQQLSSISTDDTGHMESERTPHANNPFASPHSMPSGSPSPGSIPHGNETSDSGRLKATESNAVVLLPPDSPSSSIAHQPTLDFSDDMQSS